MNKEMLNLGNNRSIIRELFEFSKTQKSILGAENVFDFSILLIQFIQCKNLTLL